MPCAMRHATDIGVPWRLCHTLPPRPPPANAHQGIQGGRGADTAFRLAQVTAEFFGHGFKTWHMPSTCPRFLPASLAPERNGERWWAAGMNCRCHSSRHNLAVLDCAVGYTVCTMYVSTCLVVTCAARNVVNMSPTIYQVCQSSTSFILPHGRWRCGHGRLEGAEDVRGT
jgi:hypothetical protein